MKTSSSPSPPASLVGLATLAALGLAAVPVHAQSLTLNSGDSLTVSGAGTVGMQNGLPVANTVSSYYGGAAGPAAATSYTSTFTLANGGSLSGAENINGPGGYGLLTGGSGAVTITGGSITGGKYGDAIQVGGTGRVNISGGTFRGTGGDSGTFRGTGTSAALVVGGFAPVNISGGTFTADGQYGTALVTNNCGPVTITGGIFSIGGASGYGFYDYGSTINLFSLNDSAFLVDGVSMNNTSLSSYLYLSGSHTISGTLANGDLLNTTFQDHGYINLNLGTPPALPVPEASTTVSLGLLLMLGAGGLAVACRKRA